MLQGKSLPSPLSLFRAGFSQPQQRQTSPNPPKTTPSWEAPPPSHGALPTAPPAMPCKPPNFRMNQRSRAPVVLVVRRRGASHNALKFQKKHLPGRPKDDRS